MGRYWYRWATGKLDAEMRLLRPLLRPGTVAIDAGANRGVYSYYFARAGLRVEAFEPLPQCQAAIGAVHSSRVRVHQAALSDAPSERRLYVPIIHGAPELQMASFGQPSGAVETLVVPVTTIDRAGLRDVSVMKIDVEGHELAVLRGSAETIARDRPVLLVEIERRHAGAEAMATTLSWLAERGYLGFFVAPNGRVAPLRDFDVEEHQQRWLDGVAGAQYVNNFVFAHEGDRRAVDHLTR